MRALRWVSLSPGAGVARRGRPEPGGSLGGVACLFMPSVVVAYRPSNFVMALVLCLGLVPTRYSVTAAAILVRADALDCVCISI